jgi:hypothetical protein
VLQSHRNEDELFLEQACLSEVDMHKLLMPGYDLGEFNAIFVHLRLQVVETNVKVLETPVELNSVNNGSDSVFV